MNVAEIIGYLGCDNDHLREQAHNIILENKENIEFVNGIKSILLNQNPNLELVFITVKTIDFYHISLDIESCISLYNLVIHKDIKYFQPLRFAIANYVSKQLTIENIPYLLQYFDKYPQDILYACLLLTNEHDPKTFPEPLLTLCINIINQSDDVYLLTIAAKIAAKNDVAANMLIQRTNEIYQNEITYQNYPVYQELFPIFQLNPESQELINFMQQKIIELSNLAPFTKSELDTLHDLYDISEFGYLLMNWLNMLLINEPEFDEELENDDSWSINKEEIFPYICRLCMLSVDDREQLINDPEAFVLFSDYFAFNDFDENKREISLRYECSEFLGLVGLDVLCDSSVELMNSNPELQEPILYMYGQNTNKVVDYIPTIALPDTIADDILAYANFIPLAALTGKIELNDLQNFLTSEHFPVVLAACRGISKNIIYSELCLPAISRVFEMFDLFETGIVCVFLDLINELLEKYKIEDIEVLSQFFEMLAHITTVFRDPETINVVSRILFDFTSKPNFYPIIFEAFLPVISSFMENTDSAYLALQLISYIFEKLPMEGVELPDSSVIRNFIVTFAQSELNDNSHSTMIFLAKSFCYLCRVGFVEETLSFILYLIPIALEKYQISFIGSLIADYITIANDPLQMISHLLEISTEYLKVANDQKFNHCILRFIGAIIGFYITQHGEIPINQQMIDLAIFDLEIAELYSSRFEYLLLITFLLKVHPDTNLVHAHLQEYLQKIFYSLSNGEILADNRYIDFFPTDPIISSHNFSNITIYGFMKSLYVPGCPEYIPKWLDDHKMYFMDERFDM